MKIGIITFHWATNYGAILQTYALQEYLKEQGHTVCIINFKPTQYDFRWSAYFKHPYKLIRLNKIIQARRKESLLSSFRNSHLQLTERYFSIADLRKKACSYDVLISGSDQVLNPSFTTSGEGGPSAAYYLDFANNIKKIGYAVSFGCTKYPDVALEYAKHWINNFSTIGVREDSGISLLSDMGFKGKSYVVPDPTILLGNILFSKLGAKKFHQSSNNICLYFLRKRLSLNTKNIIIIDETSKAISMDKWIDTIINSKGLVTNSYHGMIVALLNHIPFVAVLETNHAVGMNDRFYTLLKRVKLENRICHEGDDYLNVLSKDIDWHSVDYLLSIYRVQAFNVLNI